VRVAARGGAFAFMTIRSTRLAKLTRPPVPRSAYARTRLLKLLDGLDTPAIWVTGPPGSGKTTLVADYTIRSDIDCLWYQMDRGDSDPGALFRVLTEAVGARGGDGPLPQFEPVYLGDLELFARGFFRELYRQTPPFLVFDNYQNLGGGAAHDIALTAIEELPAGGRVFVISHTDPPARLAALQAREQLAVVRWNELQLSQDECRGIVEARKLHLSDPEIAELHTRTQGWAAGLILLLQDRGTRPTTPSPTLGATPMVIFDYVAEQLFEKFDPPIREFLLRVAYLPQVTLAMAEQIAPPGEARGMLRHLALREFLLTVVQPEPAIASGVDRQRKRDCRPPTLHGPRARRARSLRRGRRALHAHGPLGRVDRAHSRSR
jgi:LuxR family maltose regulon positive regulatory protein